jgi:hypothetical protein
MYCMELLKAKLSQRYRDGINVIDYCGLEVYLHALITKVLYVCSCADNFNSRPPLPRWNNHQYDLNKSHGLRAIMDALDKRKLSYILCLGCCGIKDKGPTPSPHEHKPGSTSVTLSQKPSVSCYIRLDVFTHYLNSWDGDNISLTDGLPLSFNPKHWYVTSATKYRNSSLH